ncbi:unnamed protein product [Paramecium sonneborni]|uniref:Insertion element IS150 protein InsJ-like helix-turn-helix domain-containing protein n=1 Tax=Paramecium sonneborni TaxID=65129 RepID=A0A8S1PSI7_9CILI|nr:unnamed protein product [Paramecium sonneborni]
MDSKFDCNQTKKKYAIITHAVRMAFIKRVQSKQTTIKQAAQEFGIKFSTSKAILQTYKQEGRIGKKKTRLRKGPSKNQSKQENQDQKQKIIDSNDQQSHSKPLTIDLNQLALQKQQALQFQIFQLSLNMNPYQLLHQNLCFQQNLQQDPILSLLNYQAMMHNTFRTRTFSEQSGKILEQKQMINPILYSQCLSQKLNEIGTI